MNKTQALPSAIHPSLNRTRNHPDAMTHPQLIRRLFLLVSVLISASSASVSLWAGLDTCKRDECIAGDTVQRAFGIIE